jgi:hypothetical protein
VKSSTQRSKRVRKPQERVCHVQTTFVDNGSLRTASYAPLLLILFYFCVHKKCGRVRSARVTPSRPPNKAPVTPRTSEPGRREERISPRATVIIVVVVIIIEVVPTADPYRTGRERGRYVGRNALQGQVRLMTPAERDRRGVLDTCATRYNNYMRANVFSGSEAS